MKPVAPVTSDLILVPLAETMLNRGLSAWITMNGLNLFYPLMFALQVEKIITTARILNGIAVNFLSNFGSAET